MKGGVFLTLTATIVIVLSRKYTPNSNNQIQLQQQCNLKAIKLPKQLEMVKNNNLNDNIDYFMTPSTMETIRYIYNIILKKYLFTINSTDYTIDDIETPEKMEIEGNEVLPPLQTEEEAFLDQIWSKPSI